MFWRIAIPNAVRPITKNATNNSEMATAASELGSDAGGGGVVTG
jgi:hypothetical protein